MFSLYRAIVVGAVGAVLVIWTLIKGQWLDAATVFFISAAAVCAVWNLSVETFHVKALAGVATLFGFCAVFFGSNASNFDLQKGYSAAQRGFINIGSKCPSTSQELRKLEYVGLMACSSQANQDQRDMTADAIKTERLGPILSMGDSAKSLIEPAKVNECATAYKEAQRLCPNVFIGMDAKQHEALLKAAE